MYRISSFVLTPYTNVNLASPKVLLQGLRQRSQGTGALGGPALEVQPEARLQVVVLYAFLRFCSPTKHLIVGFVMKVSASQAT